ncbi:MAG: restriction endonuclease [Acidobacteriota bacterium]
MNLELFHRFLEDETITIEQLLAVLPHNGFERFLQSEMARIVEEEGRAKGEEERIDEQLAEYRAVFVNDGTDFANYHAIDDIETYQQYPNGLRQDRLRRSREKLNELRHFELLYANSRFAHVCHVVTPDFKTVNDELIEYFGLHPNELHQLEWRKFEYLLDAIFRNQGSHTELGPGSGDAGVDIRLVQKDSIGELVTLVQAKRYDPQYPVKLEAVAALYGVVEHQQASRGLFVTTSRFLPSASQFAQMHGHRLVLAVPEDVAGWCRRISTRGQS